MPPPKVFTSPPSRGSAIHPLLTALTLIAPRLKDAILASDTGPGTLSAAAKKTLQSLGSSSPSAQPIWSLIGEDKLIPIDPPALLAQMCDLFDAELNYAARDALGAETCVEIAETAGARVAEDQLRVDYALNLALAKGKETLRETAKANFEPVLVDHFYPSDDLPSEANRAWKICSPPRQGLVLTLQRTKFNASTGQNAKVYDKLTFDLKEKGTELLAPHARSMEAKAGLEKIGLTLVAVLAHSDEYGYTLAALSDQDKKWYECYKEKDTGDADVPPTELAASLNAGLEKYFGTGNPATGDNVAYMLFYRVEGGAKPGSKFAGSLTNPKDVRMSAALKAVSSSKLTGAKAVKPYDLAPPSPLNLELDGGAPALEDVPTSPIKSPKSAAPGGGAEGCCVVS